MKKIIKNATAVAGAALLLAATGATATTLISGSSIADNTLQATDLGTNVTRVKIVNVTIPPSDSYEDCSMNVDGDPRVGGEPCAVVTVGAGTRYDTLTCGTGNVASGSVKVSPEDGYVEQSYAHDDDTWVFALVNFTAEPTTASLRLVCI